MMRAGIVLLTREGVAAIERVRDRMTYHTLPGGQIEDGESPAEAARREAFEELGLLVKIRGLVAVVHFGLRTQHYFLAESDRGGRGAGSGVAARRVAAVAGGVRGGVRLASWVTQLMGGPVGGLA